MSYIINEKTNYLLVNGEYTEVHEEEQELTINRNVIKLIDDSCCHYGSSYLGRKKGTKYLINVTSKPPIMVNEQNYLIIFPIRSPRSENCIWIIYNNIEKFTKKKEYTEVIFKNQKKLHVNVSYNTFNNQVLKCSRLYSICALRK